MTPAPADRPSICYLVPGHHLLPSSGPTRNVLSLATALSEWADVTVAFRRRLDDGAFDAVPVRELDPRRSPSSSTVSDDAALRGVGYGDFFRYMDTLRRFVNATAGEFDVVLEKSWLLSGFMSGLYRRRKVPSVAIENVVPTMSSAGRTSPASRLKHSVARRIAGRCLGRVPWIVAETEALRSSMVDLWSLDPVRIEVVPLGVDRERFAPADRGVARERLGIPSEELCLLYVGVLDRMHDLAPVLGAIGAAGPPTARLHLVGDGPLRATYAEQARRAGVEDRVRFWGRVPHADVPGFIAASDLCLAPYDPAAFHNGQVGYSTLKIHECLAAGRPVASVRSGAIPDLIEHGANGLLVDHGDAGWRRLIADLPDRPTLHAMGAAAAERPSRSWRDVAVDYLRICRQATAVGVGA